MSKLNSKYNKMRKMKLIKTRTIVTIVTIGALSISPYRSFALKEEPFSLNHYVSEDGGYSLSKKRKKRLDNYFSKDINKKGFPRNY